MLCAQTPEILARLRIPSRSGRPSFSKLGKGRSTIGSAPGPGGIRIPDPTVSAQHAVMEKTKEGWFVYDLETAHGTRVADGVTSGWVKVKPFDTVNFGSVECRFEPGPLARYLHYFGFRGDRESWRSIVPSVAFHLLVIILLSQVVLTAAKKEPSDFDADDTSGFLTVEAPEGKPPGGEAAAGLKAPDPMQAPSAGMATVTTSMIVSTAPSALSFAPPSGGVGQMPAPMALSAGGGGGASYRSAGLGKGSGIGKGVGDWVGGGSGGIGISGRGKTLKTLREFSVYFVIHSGDWYAALDTREAPAGRQREVSPQGLPDTERINWGDIPPEPGTGPFINSFWGMRLTPRGYDDERHSLVEFTPGAMGNLLKFVRTASADNIKGSPKPRGVVLDKSLVPYEFDPATGATTWNSDGREKLREVLRKGLPVLDNFYGGSFGYIWNPKPGDREHTDFTVEYLLDVKPMPPFIYFTGNDDFTLSDAEVDTLYNYVLRGGAIWGDSGFAGNRSKFDTAFRREMKRVIPDVDKPFRLLKKQGDLFVDGADAYFDKTNGFAQLPHGLQFYDSPIEVIEVLPGVVSVVLTKNAYGNLLRFETSVVNNRFQLGGDIGRGKWATTMWKFREGLFRGLDEASVVESYKLGTNILVYMLGRWPAVLNRPENKGMVP